jgi:hypothetical protein
LPPGELVLLIEYAPLAGGGIGYLATICFARSRVGPRRLFNEGDCEGQVVQPYESNRDPIGERAQLGRDLA